MIYDMNDAWEQLKRWIAADKKYFGDVTSRGNDVYDYVLEHMEILERNVTPRPSRSLTRETNR